MFPPSFLWIYFIAFFLRNAFHFSDRQIIQKLILYHIFNAYPCIIFINKGVSTVQKLHVQCEALKVFFSLLIEIDKVSRRLIYTVDHILVSSNPCFYNILCLKLSLRFPSGFWWKYFVAIFLKSCIPCMCKANRPKVYFILSTSCIPTY